MRRRITALLLIIVFLFSQPLIAHASTRALNINPHINFDINTVNCTVAISSDIGYSIVAYIYLYEGNTLIKSWYRTGTEFLFFSDSAHAQNGYRYTLKVDAIIAGTKQPTVTASATYVQ